MPAKAGIQGICNITAGFRQRLYYIALKGEELFMKVFESFSNHHKIKIEEDGLLS